MTELELRDDGDARQAADRAVAQLRQAGRELTATDELRVLLVARAASLVDAATAANDAALLLRAIDKLRGLLHELDPRMTQPLEGSDDDDGSSDRDALGDRLERALRAGPTMGDGTAP